jgi:uncharacterized protein YjbI with pentapeptide repeats
MTEITNSNHDAPESQPAKPVRTLEALIELYQQGYRNFSGSDLRGVTVDMVDKEIKCLDLKGIILTGSNLTAIVFSKSTSAFKVDLTGSIFKNCNLRLANLYNCRLDQCNFSNADLSGANLSSCSFRGSDFIKTILQNINSQSSDFTASDFAGANFLRSTISGNFTATNFIGANLRSATLSGEFKQADFSGSDLRSAKCSNNFTGSNFSGANLSSASLNGQFSQAIFCKSNLHTANLNAFVAQGADFSDADLQVSTVSSGSLKYSYYNSKTKFSECLDPVASGMELIEDEIESED